MSFPVLTIHLLGGVVFVLSIYVIVRYLIRWKKHGMHLLPLHVWLISVSYNLLIVSILLGGSTENLTVYLTILALLLGIYSLWILGRFQTKTQRTVPRRRKEDI